ncbi:MAG: hypothetical protein IPP83_18145 [Flavobacteriales bacterium]|nr:hypothetical protein [Flavobacteriales bacterium]
MRAASAFSPVLVRDRPKGVKPVCAFQQVFQYTYVFGAYSPISGDNFQLELPCCSGYTFRSSSLQRIDPKSSRSVDNGAFHKTKHLSWPLNGAHCSSPIAPQLQAGGASTRLPT